LASLIRILAVYKKFKEILDKFDQGCESVTFWHGSEIPNPQIRTDPDPALFVSNLQDAKKFKQTNLFKDKKL
jgi:hypothetical protein